MIGYFLGCYCKISVKSAFSGFHLFVVSVGEGQVTVIRIVFSRATISDQLQVDMGGGLIEGSIEFSLMYIQDKEIISFNSSAIARLSIR